MTKGIAFEHLGAEAGRGIRLAIAVARFNGQYTEALLEGCLRALREHGAELSAVPVVRVPGCFELPWAARALAQADEYEAVICLGCLIRGETSHFEVLARATATGVTQAALESGVPVIFGVLTVHNEEQARARTRPDRTNKGYEAALSALEMALLGRELRG